MFVVFTSTFQHLCSSAFLVLFKIHGLSHYIIYDLLGMDIPCLSFLSLREFFQMGSRVNTILGLYHLDSNKSPEEKTK